MPLSEHEQRMLDQLERQLNDEDPRLATQLAETSRPALPVRRIVLGAVLGVVGLLVILAGVSTHLLLVGVLGTLLLGAGILVLTARRPAQAARPGRSGRPTPDAGRGEFMSRLEQRWDERRRREP
ncbi:DUF3040 domain-containing protein [uncultured Micrococcus sp.]|uniref:DUF3040 domain-containing protein n=1 Tax=uncultured Micrococcus sp. TaxID=114051 RepID=UPI00260E0A0E|nr:DUF3040 domain-containing protein [uncultured Micrococcus sp.]